MGRVRMEWAVTMRSWTTVATFGWAMRRERVSASCAVVMVARDRVVSMMAMPRPG